jgi:hypothetical protein
MTEQDARAVLSKYKKFELFLRTNKILVRWINAYIRAGKPEKADWIEKRLIDRTLIWINTGEEYYWSRIHDKCLAFFRDLENEI